MRLDKFLKVSRLIKRRTVAQEICEANRVLLNGREAKSSSKLKIGDVIEIQFGNQEPLKVKVLELKETVRKEEANSLYEVIL